ncbi:MAG: selenide, water dikinase SelD [Gemmatimonadota bacterium]|nr:selenide, water dikinase SelD [Gemmatimonadota bacterium]
MGPGDLAEVLAPIPGASDERILVGRETFDDAGVFLLTDELALVQTVDFFAPIVDDPYTFGQIAAANAMSDVYAMGGQPLTALNIVAFPKDKLPLSVLTDVLRGGLDKVHEAGAHIIGGHTVLDDELKYGLAVTGKAHPKFLLTNAGARAGDKLILTKPLGSGILATAIKHGSLDAGAQAEVLASMTALNGGASRAALAVGSRCATDVTGFGLLGHASHVARTSAVTLRINAAAVPAFTGAVAAWEGGFRTAGADRNLEYVNALVDWGAATDAQRALLVDPQTSGGLLVAVGPDRVAAYLSKVAGAVEIGTVTERTEFAIVLQ